MPVARSPDAGSRAHAVADTAQVRGVAVVGYIKGKSAIHLARVYGERKRNFVGQSFWARGYFVSTVGRNEEVIRTYIRNREAEDRRLEVVIAHCLAPLKPARTHVAAKPARNAPSGAAIP